MDQATATVIAALIALVGTTVAAIIGYRAIRSKTVNGGREGVEGQNAEGPAPIWPEQQNLDALTRRLERTSNTNRSILRHLAQGERYVKINDLSDGTNVNLNELSYRMRELERQQLVEEIDTITTEAYKLHDRVLQTLGPDGKDLLKRLLA